MLEAQLEWKAEQKQLDFDRKLIENKDVEKGVGPLATKVKRALLQMQDSDELEKNSFERCYECLAKYAQIVRDSSW
jgi:hypothetical protein